MWRNGPGYIFGDFGLNYEYYLNQIQKLLSENKNLSGEPFNFGPGSSQDRSVIELIEEAKNLFFYTKYNLQEKNKTLFKESKLLKLNCDKSLMKLNWLPVLNFKETVLFTMNWYTEFYKSKKINKEMIFMVTIVCNHFIPPLSY